MAAHVCAVLRGPRVLGLTVMVAIATWGAEQAPRLPPLEHAGERLSAFAARNAPDQVDRLARDLLRLTFLAEWGDRDFNRPGRWAQLKEVRARMDAGDYPAALERFKRYTLDKLRALDDYGLPIARFDPYAGGPAMWNWIHPLVAADQRETLLQQARELMDGVVLVGDRRIEIGEPGAINWQAASTDARKDGGVWPWHVDAFSPLIAAYLLTGQRNYLDRWSAYADDWAMNQAYSVGATALAELPDQWAGGAESTITVLRYLRGVALLPSGSDDFPAATFARVLMRLIGDYLPTTVMYHRANPQNWNDVSASTLVDVGFFLDEYRCAPDLLRDGLRQFALIAPARHLPDGVDNDSTVGYGFTYLIGAAPILERLKFRMMRLADWQLPSWEKRDLREHFQVDVWERDVREEMRDRARFLAGHLMASGEWPIGGTRTDHRDRAHETNEKLLYFVPEVFQDPDVARILAIGSGGMKIPPSFTSERFPYGGLTYMRAGWDPRDPYLFMFCSPKPTVGSLSWRNNNAIGISAYGEDLIETGENGTYDQPHTPVRVDGQEQFFHAGIPTWGHRGPMLTAWHEPAPWRWSTSPWFDLAEGIYAGAFGKSPGCTDVSHQRMVHFVRAARLWIITDRLRSPAAHAYALDWRFGILPGKHAGDFTPEQIGVAKDDAAIRTARPGLANVSLYHFPSAPLVFTSTEERTPEKNGYRLHDFLRVSAEWKAQRESVVVTAIFPRQNEREELTDIKPLNAPGSIGFTATTPQGMHIQYQAAVEVPATLRLGDLSASGESLLLTVAPDGSRRGIALGCHYLSLAGKAVALSGGDGEFVVNGPEVPITPISTPLAPITILPANHNVFVGQETISLACATPGAEIRYTCDGSEPTPAAPLYRAPFVIRNDTLIKARALRAGVTTMPSGMSGTLISVVTKARFVAATPLKAVATPATEPGLRYEYYEGRWQELLMTLGVMIPVRSGVVQRLFDQTVKPTATTFAFRYSGFLDVPADGVYTFIAPRESYMPDIMAGYDLDVIVDGERWYPACSLHALGSWSIALQKGKHRLVVVYRDLRGDGAQKMNKPGLPPLVWEGVFPALKIAGPGLTTGPIPANLLCCAKAASDR